MAKTAWIPTEDYMRSTRLYQWMNKLGYTNYDSFYRQSITDIGWFWDEAVQDMGIKWHRPYNQVLDLSKGKEWPSWFVDGELNVTQSALDKWLQDSEMAQSAALIWEGEDEAVRSYTFAELTEWVDRVAHGLKQMGIVKGDRIAIYLPMIPETVVAMLAICKVGAIFVPNFSGYGAEAVSKRLEGSGAKMLITADGYYRRGKVIPMKEAADEAVKLVNSVEKVVTVRRIGCEIPWDEARDVDWSELEAAKGSSDTEWLKSDDPFMLIYTSGTTGKPKGTVHIHSGFPIKGAFDAAYGMDVKKGDVLFWVTDMGWMMGPFLVFASLLNGAAMLMYEGTPDYPQPNRLWKLVEDHRITHLGISPTLIRSMISQGADSHKGIDLSNLRVIGSTGEPWNPEPWLWLFEQVGKRRIPIFNYSGGTEISGGILGNVLLKPIAPANFSGPLPGMDADVFDANGAPIRGEVGELVMKQPWVGMTHGFWQDPKRYEETYWGRWPGVWVHGDWVEIDEDGFWNITGRSDDTLNVAGKRVGPAEIESILVDHSSVIESATIGVPDSIKGEDIVCFVVLKQQVKPEPELTSELVKMVEGRMGKALKPKRIHFVSELPKTRNGKVMRRVIRAAYLSTDPGDLSSLENPDVLALFASLASEG